ncbi:MAG TPA: hypothetical protein VM864_02995 [Pyrinomonadaceae bacterium]|jgi:hypothetical protein|nr:hypothetical protein [Pyrinomonadaceae bacterium]
MGGGDGSDIFARYSVGVFPATYLLDAEGRIVYRSAGFNEASLRRALSKLGMN